MLDRENNTDCIFCNRLKKGWNSDMTLWFDWGKFKITVCPDCRKNKTILDLNKKISEKYYKGDIK